MKYCKLLVKIEVCIQVQSTALLRSILLHLLRQSVLFSHQLNFIKTRKLLKGQSVIHPIQLKHDFPAGIPGFLRLQVFKAFLQMQKLCLRFYR